MEKRERQTLALSLKSPKIKSGFFGCVPKSLLQSKIGQVVRSHISNECQTEYFVYTLAFFLCCFAFLGKLQAWYESICTLMEFVARIQNWSFTLGTEVSHFVFLGFILCNLHICYHI